MSRAIPFIKYHNNQFQLDPQAEQFLLSIPPQDKIGVISIVGKYRTGKSFFVNRVLLNQQNAFSVGPTINPCTKGLWLWSQLLPSQNAEYPDMKTLILDTEGFGGMDENVNHDTRIFLFSLLLSSYFIYNSVGNIDENALNTISLIVNLAKEIQVSHEGMFPQFLWVVRDFALQMVNQQGNPIVSKEYLENALELQKGLSDQVEQKNRIRRMIKHFFKERDCMTMVRPVEQERDLQRLDTLQDTDLRGEFIQQMNGVRAKIFKKVKPKMLQNAYLNGQQLLNLAKAYIDTMNSGKVPNVESAWTYVCKAEGEKALSDCLSFVDQQICQLKREVIQWDKMAQLRTELLDKAKKQFRQKAVGQEEDFSVFFDRMGEQLDEKFKDLKQQNKKNMSNHYRIILEPYLDRILEQLRNEEFANYFELQTEMFKLRDTFEKEVGRSQKVSKYFDQMSLTVYQQAAEKLVRKQSQLSQQETKKLQLKIADLEKQNQGEKQRLSEERKLILEEKNKLLEERNKLVEDKDKLQNQFSQLQESQNFTHQKQQHSLDKLKNENQQYQNQFDKQQALHQQEKTFLQKELTQLQDRLTQSEQDSKRLRSELVQVKALNENLQQRCQSLDFGRAQEIQKLQLEFEKKIQELTNDIDSKKQNVRIQSEWMVEKSYLENQVGFLKSQLDENKRLHDALLIALQQNGNNNDYQEGTLELLETNRNLSAAMDKIEVRCKQLEEKITKLKNYKKYVRNSQSLQCLHCQKSFSSSAFPQHLVGCMEQPQQYQQQQQQQQQQQSQNLVDLSQLQISINQTMVRETPDNKPYTEYMIRVQYNNKKWTVSRRYKNFCELHQSMTSQFPNLKVPESSSAIINTADIGSVFNGKRPTVIEERRKALQQYIRDLAKIDMIRNSNFYRKFLELDDQTSRSVSQMSSPKNEGLQSSRDQWKQQTSIVTSSGVGPSTSRSMIKDKKENNMPPPCKIDRKLLPQSPQSFLKAFQKQQENSKVYRMNHQQSLLEMSDC